MPLALEGGKPAIPSPLKPYSSIGVEELRAAERVLKTGPLSGFLGGERHGGLNVQALEQRMCEEFGAKYAVAVNSATSGLLVACMATGVGPDTQVVVPALTMSASAAAPAFLGAQIEFGDVWDKTFTLMESRGKPHTFITTNLFGHPAHLKNSRYVAHATKSFMIEDNAQGWYAREGDKYAGTVGHIGVYSFNVHKHIHCGEGGICLTSDEMLADSMRLARNHGELAGAAVGLNLRMTELEAAIALAQLDKAKKLVKRAQHVAEELTTEIANYDGLVPPLVREDCDHSFYIWALTVAEDREWFVKAMQAEDFPIKAGYVDPLYRLPAFQKYKSRCPNAEWLHDVALCTYENCAYDPSATQLRQMKDAINKVGEAYVKRQSTAAA